MTQRRRWSVDRGPCRFAAATTDATRIRRNAVQTRAIPLHVALLAAMFLAGSATAWGNAEMWDAREHPVDTTYHLILNETFEGGLENWVLEGDADVASVGIEDGKGVFRTRKNELSEGAMWWYNDDLPADFRAEWTVTPKTDGFFMVFFSVRGVDGDDIFSDKHRGAEEKEWGKYFQKYVHGDINGYHVSYHRRNNGDCNLRKNTGLVLLKNQTDGPHPLAMNRSHRVVLTKLEGRIHLTVDGTTFLDYVDDGKAHGPVHGSGKFGFRQVYGSEATYDDVRIYDLTGEAETTED